MCVIAAMIDRKISKEDLLKCERANKDGGGVSWVEDGKVHWKKGIDGKEMWKIIEKVALPCVAHFRISTTGTYTKALTHPFPIEEQCSTALHGSADRVLFHNGMWNKWDDWCMEMVVMKNIVFPGGEWSDSRAMAWMIHHSNPSFLRFVGQKIAIHTADKVYMWGSFTEKDGIYYSNMGWDYPVKTWPEYKGGKDSYGYGSLYTDYGKRGVGFNNGQYEDKKQTPKTETAEDTKLSQEEMRDYLAALEGQNE